MEQIILPLESFGLVNYLFFFFCVNSYLRFLVNKKFVQQDLVDAIKKIDIEIKFGTL